MLIGAVEMQKHTPFASTPQAVNSEYIISGILKVEANKKKAASFVTNIIVN